MRLIWRGPEFSETVWGAPGGFEDWGRGWGPKSGHPQALRGWSSYSMNLGYGMVAVRREEPSPLGFQGRSAVPFLTRGCPTAAGAVGVDAVSLARLVLT